MQHFNLIIDKRQVKYLLQKKPAPPNLKVQLKLHKIGIPIQPVINNRTALAYKLAKYLTNILSQHITLHNQYVITNSTNLAHDLSKLELHENHSLITFDIKDLYVNISVSETLNIVIAKLLQNNDSQIAQQVLILLKEILSQNYFTFQQGIYQPEQGIAMGSPISSIIAEIFLQNFEDTHIKHLLDTRNLAFYTRYIDDILIIYDTTRISSYTINSYINNIHRNIKLNPTYEQHRSIDFLDLTVTRKHKKLEVDIYRKPTCTDTTINFLSNHPIEQKMAAFRFHITRMHSLPLNPDEKQKEWKTIQHTAKNNNFPHCLLQKLNHQIQNKVNHTHNEKKHKIWTTFTYHSPKIRRIKNLFKNTNIGIAFKATATLQQILIPTTRIQTSPHEKSRIYKITCKTCHKAYVGQTNRNLNLRIQEHVRYIKNNDPRSAYAAHILNCRHEYGNITETMTLLKQINRPSLLLPYEQMYIYRFSIETITSSRNNVRMNTIPCSNFSSTHLTYQLDTNQYFRPSVSPLSTCILYGCL